jgi:hypothetical protein
MQPTAKVLPDSRCWAHKVPGQKPSTELSRRCNYFPELGMVVEQNLWGFHPGPLEPWERVHRDSKERLLRKYTAKARGGSVIGLQRSFDSF